MILRQAQSFGHQTVRRQIMGNRSFRSSFAWHCVIRTIARCLASSLRQAALLYHERAIRAAEWYAEYLPIVLTVLVGGTITAGFTLFVLWPYASTLHEFSSWNWR